MLSAHPRWSCSLNRQVRRGGATSPSSPSPCHAPLCPVAKAGVDVIIPFALLSRRSPGGIGTLAASSPRLRNRQRAGCLPSLLSGTFGHAILNESVTLETCIRCPARCYSTRHPKGRTKLCTHVRCSSCHPQHSTLSSFASSCAPRRTEDLGRVQYICICRSSRERLYVAPFRTGE